MNIKKTAINGITVAVIEPEGGEIVLRDTPSALDLIMTAKFEAETDRIAIHKKAVAEDFFILSTGVAGEILQKYINYGIKLAIYGDFSRYTSKPLRDFIYESNRGNDFFFAADEQEAVQRLCGAR
ncbi:DUF4180 domain-containing protein [Clostridium sp. D33t1_170424_F3]|uniref:DUF4180 domain-containing protein n=1 Tax=Clostridium sp. D33t1_170424_F3 TaxID=2787099 RepID=UPI0018AA7A7B|nr:DUF4180 domain-containing protein [Clostridium sp. D33t1_170424_F3]